MVSLQPPEAGARSLLASGADRDGRDGGQRSPVVMLSYPHGGAERLRTLLDRHPDLACTTATGILPLCEQAAVTWRKVDGRAGGPLPALGAAATRALAAGLMAAVLSRTGRRRWCETALGAVSSAAAFLELYPGTRFLCLHRSCADVIHEALRASPWGLAGAAFAPFNVAHPNSNAAALTAYWSARTEELISFEAANPAAVRRIRYEDLSAGVLDSDTRTFLGLDQAPPGDPGLWLREAAVVVDDEALRGRVRDLPGFPVGQLPPQLLRKANGLLGALGYPPLDACA